MSRVTADIIDDETDARGIIPERDHRGLRSRQFFHKQQIFYDQRPVRKIVIMGQLKAYRNANPLSMYLRHSIVKIRERNTSRSSTEAHTVKLGDEERQENQPLS